MLAPAALERRASAVPGSREVLVRSPRHEYAHLVVGADNPSLPPPFSPSALRAYVDMAWLSEGSATFFAGQVPHMRGAIARRLREGRRPRFPPKARDAWVLGGTVFALLEREMGVRACVDLARTPDGAGDRRAIERPSTARRRAWSAPGRTTWPRSGRRDRPASGPRAARSCGAVGPLPGAARRWPSPPGRNAAGNREAGVARPRSPRCLA